MVLHMRSSTRRCNLLNTSLTAHQHPPLLFLLILLPRLHRLVLPLLNNVASLLLQCGKYDEETANYLFVCSLGENECVGIFFRTFNFNFFWQVMVYRRDIAHQYIQSVVRSYVVSDVHHSYPMKFFYGLVCSVWIILSIWQLPLTLTCVYVGTVIILHNRIIGRIEDPSPASEWSIIARNYF